MEKIKHDNILVFLITFVLFIPWELCININFSDEIWNFNNIYKMYLGYQIYAESNVIITPLFLCLGNAFFHLLGANIFVFRIYGATIISFFMLLTYIFLKELNIKKDICIIFLVSIFFYITYVFPLMGANYNILAICFYLLGVIYTIKTKEKTKKYYIIQGIVAFLVFFVKQNIGIYYILGFTINHIVEKEKIIEKAKKYIIFIVSFLVILAISLIAMYIKGNLSYFIDYCFLGIGDFAKENLKIDAWALLAAGIILLINIGLLIFLFKNKKTRDGLTKEKKKNLKEITIFSIPIMMTVYPIFNMPHIYIGIYICLINIFYILNIIFKNLKIKEIIKKVYRLTLLVIIIFFYFGAVNKFALWEKYMNSQTYYEYKDPFFGGFINYQLEDNIETIDEFISNSKEDVIILSPKAALYNIPLKINNGDYDLLLTGNLGSKGEKGIIEDIKQKKNCIYLLEDKQYIYQESKMIKEYVKNNLKEVGKIEEFTIYKNE